MAAKVVVIGFTDIHHLAGTHEDDVTDFPSPVHRAVFLQFVQYMECTKALKRKREEQVLKTLVSSGASASTSSLEVRPARLAQGPASAEDLAAQIKDIDPEKLQTSISKVLETWDVPVLAGTPTAVAASVTQAHDQGRPVLDDGH